MEHTNEQARIFNDSYERVMYGPVREAFFTAFYERLIASSDEAARKFRQTDMNAQVRMLQASIAILLSYYTTGHQDQYLLRLAERHSKSSADISPGLYAVWLDCLLETVRQFDSNFSDQVATAWRTVFSKGIEFMTSRYDGA